MLTSWDKRLFSFSIFALRYFAVRARVCSKSWILQDRVEPRLRRHEPEEVVTVAFAIAHRVFAVPAQCQSHHGESHYNV